MKSKSINQTGFRIITSALIITVALCYYNFVEVDAAGALKTPLFPKVARASNTSLKITWHKVSDASGYEIFRYNAKSKKYKKVATIAKAGTVKWVDKGLDTGKKYTYKIRSFKRSGLTKEVSDYSYVISAVPYKKNAKVVNAGNKLKGASTMKVGISQTLPVKVTAVPSKFGTAKKKKVVDPKIRVLPVSSSLFTQSGKNITGMNVGSTNINVIAHNGNVKKVKVNVVDYAKPKSWKNLDKLNPLAVSILVDQKDQLTDLAAYFERFKGNVGKSGSVELNADGNLVFYKDISLGGKKDEVLQFLSGCPLPVSFWINEYGIAVNYCDYASNPPLNVTFAFFIADPPQSDLIATDYVIAEHWYYAGHRLPEGE